MRGFVIILIPVSIIDAFFTLQGVMIYGPEAEMNPIGRFLLGLGYWPLWVALNVVGFTFLHACGILLLAHKRYKGRS